MKNLILLPLVLILSSKSFCQTSWIGTTGIWENPANWDCFCIPSIPDHPNIKISGDTAKVTVTGAVTINFINIENDAELTIVEGAGINTKRISNSAYFENYGTFSATNAILGDGIINTGNFNNYGFISIHDTGNNDGIENWGAFLNQGTLNILNIPVKNGIYNRGNFINDGYLSISNIGDHGIANIGGEFINDGNTIINETGLDGIYAFNSEINNSFGFTIDISNTGDDGLSLIAGSDFTNSGTIKFGNNITNDLISCNCPSGNCSSITNNASGIILGDGVINSCIITNTGNISPGNSPGNLVLQLHSSQPNFNLLGELDIEIESDSGIGIGHDKLTINGQGTLSGTLNVSFLNGFNPIIGDTYTILSCSNGCSGMFDVINCPLNYNCQITYNSNDVILEFLGILPVELLNFIGRPENEAILLSWETSSETNNEFYSIEKLKDENNFQEIGRITGNGTTNLISSYQYLDRNPSSGNNIYRLKQLDFNGNYTYSKAIAINYSESNKISIFPVPVKDELQIKISDNFTSFLTLEIYNSLGNKVKSVQRNIEEQDFFINLSELPQGSYILKCLTGKRNLKSIHFIKI